MIQRSVVELQRELSVARILGGVNEPHGSAATGGSRSVQIHTVEGVEEIRPELKPRPLGKRKILLYAQIDIRKARTADRSLGGTASELLGSRRRVRAIVKPLVAAVVTVSR